MEGDERVVSDIPLNKLVKERMKSTSFYLEVLFWRVDMEGEIGGA